MSDPIYSTTDIAEFKYTVNDLLNLKKYHVQCDVLTTTFSHVTVCKPVFVIDPTVWSCKKSWHDYTLDLIVGDTVREGVCILNDNTGPYGTTLYLSLQLSNSYFNKDDKSEGNIFSFILHVNVETIYEKKTEDTYIGPTHLYTLTIERWSGDITQDARNYVESLLQNFELIKEVFNESKLVLDANLPSTLYKTLGQYDLSDMQVTNTILNRLRGTAKLMIFNPDKTVLYESPQFLGHKNFWKYNQKTDTYRHGCHYNLSIEMSSYFDNVVTVKCYIEDFRSPVSVFKFYMKSIDDSDTIVEFGISYNPDTLFKDCAGVPYALVAMYTRKIFEHLNSLPDFVRCLDTPLADFIELKGDH